MSWLPSWKEKRKHRSQRPHLLSLAYFTAQRAEVRLPRAANLCWLMLRGNFFLPRLLPNLKVGDFPYSEDQGLVLDPWQSQWGSPSTLQPGPGLCLLFQVEVHFHSGQHMGKMQRLEGVPAFPKSQISAFLSFQLVSAFKENTLIFSGTVSRGQECHSPGKAEVWAVSTSAYWGLLTFPS